MQIITDAIDFKPPRSGQWGTPVVLALVAHALLMAALTWGVHWQKEETPVTFEAEIWSAVPREAAPRAVEPPPAGYSRRRASPSGRWLATGDNRGGITLQDLHSTAAPRSLAGHAQMVTLLEFTPDERRLVSGSMDRSARVWDLDTGTEQAVLTGHRMAVASGEFFPDGTHLLTGSWDDTARLWDLASGRELGVFGGHPASVHDVALAPDGRTFAALSGAGVLKFWNLAARREAGVISLERGTGLGWLRFSPDGAWLAAVSQSGRLTLLPAARGK